MKYRSLSVVLAATVLLLNSGLSLAVGTKTDAPQPAATKAGVGPSNAKSKVGVKHKHAARIKLVDINSATKDELKKLPGISDAEADKIIAGRPFGSKTALALDNIIPMPAYEKLKGLIVCKMTKKDIDKIMANDKQKNAKDMAQAKPQNKKK